MEESIRGVLTTGATFHLEDYAVLGAVLVITCLIGSFYAFSKSKSASDFLTGGGSMATFPTALSIATGFITAIELLGNPSEMYRSGTQFWLICIPFLIVVPITSYFYLPVFMKLRLTSSYEYLELRFNSTARYMASAIYLLQMVFYTSVAVYAPALALSHVTGLNTYLAVGAVYLVCIFYASLGGMKAVIMTDTFQTIVLLLSLIVVMIVGTILLGGPASVFDAARQTTRLELLNTDMNPTVRHTFWSVTIGGTFYWASMFCSNQASIQKYIAVRTLSQARKALWVTCISLIIIFSINFYTGLIVYARYQGCDPLTTKDIGAQDELLPFYVMNTLGDFKGIPGLFVSGILAASLGTVAAALNSLAAVSIEDILSGLLKLKIPDKKGAIISKFLSLVFGLISFGIVFIVERLGSVLQLALSFNGITGGIVLGLFSLGMFVPWASSRGAVWGSLLGLAIVSWIGIGNQIATAQGFDSTDHKPISVELCPSNVTIPEDSRKIIEPLFIYRLSYLWYTMIGFLLTVSVGLITSIATGAQDPCQLHPDLISPPIQSLLGSMPDSLKERLKLPLTSKGVPPLSRAHVINCTTWSQKQDASKGVVNNGVILNDE